MLSDQEDNVFCTTGREFPDAEKKDLMDCDNFRSDGESEDIADLLPHDPFEMNIIDISLPLDPFGMDFSFGWTEGIGPFGLKTHGANEASVDKKVDGNKLYAELSLVYTSFDFEQDEGGIDLLIKTEVGLYDDDILGHNTEELVFLGHEKYQNELVKDYVNADGDAGLPHDALSLVLVHLDVKDLLSVKMVCKSLCHDVETDTLPWKNIHIDYPLSHKITDGDLVLLTNRARGSLESLSLVKCPRITNNCLKHVLESNLGLTKLSVSGCTKLNVEEILRDLKIFNSVAEPGLKRLRIGDLSQTTNHHLKEFKVLLGGDKDKGTNSNKPRFYCADQLYLSLNDDRDIDVESCPKCHQVRQVYDCPVESCQVKPPLIQTCRACILCIARCGNCGRCLNNVAYVETLHLDNFCLDSCAKLFHCHDRVLLSPNGTLFHQMTLTTFYAYS